MDYTDGWRQIIHASVDAALVQFGTNGYVTMDMRFKDKLTDEYKYISVITIRPDEDRYARADRTVSYISNLDPKDIEFEVTARSSNPWE